MMYKILYLEEVVNKHIPNLSSSNRELIKRTIEEYLIIDPINFGKSLLVVLKVIE